MVCIWGSNHYPPALIGNKSFSWCFYWYNFPSSDFSAMQI
ncbi:hypothetical protein EC960497_4341 [Escherichia coli 96.0497]|nr:hypothetical protein EC960497_4341 [Escherichia coli 96.0497]